MRTYEIVFIVSPNTTEDDLHKLVSQLETTITERGGRIAKVDYTTLGRRKLAYPIGKFEEGIYTIIYLEGSGQEIAEVERRLRVSDLVIRHMVVRTDEDLKRAEKIKARRKVVAAGAGTEVEEELEEELEEGEDEGFES
ncbi:MAG TPA: 30S ribosomal protein S6 [Blastocatellia bacterium]|nr:30S ribosomal protein S6 [Blastocatellia bacterium]